MQKGTRNVGMVFAALLLGSSLLAGEEVASKPEEELQSGLELGKTLPAFNPIHVTGPDKGTNTCPV